MKTPTLQQVADKIAKHLKRQKKCCFNGARCLYRIEDSRGKLINACAVGCLIPKSEYSSDIEGRRVEDDKVSALMKKLNLYPFLSFLKEAQFIHDGEWENRNKAFETLCRQYKLQYNP